MFFTAVYISSSFVLRAVLNIINISTFSTLYLPPVLALNISPLLVFKTALNLDPVVIELCFIPETIYYYSLMG